MKTVRLVIVVLLGFLTLGLGTALAGAPEGIGFMGL